MECIEKVSDENFVTSDKKKKVGSYILGRTIGEGSFAKVRQGFHIIAKEKVAVKVVPKKAILLKEYVRKNVRREAIVLQKIQHPNVVRMYEVMETENGYYLVLEYIEGGEFIKYLCVKKFLPEFECRKFARQLVSAVDHLHRSNIVHRDLKLENFLLDKDLNLKIIVEINIEDTNVLQKTAMSSSGDDEYANRIPEENVSETISTSNQDLPEYNKLSRKVTCMPVKDPVQHSEPCSGASSPSCSDDEEETEFLSYYEQPSCDLKANPHLSTTMDFKKTEHYHQRPVKGNMFNKFPSEAVRINDVGRICNTSEENSEETTVLSTQVQCNSDMETDYVQVYTTENSPDINKPCCLCKEWTPVKKCLTINVVLIILLCVVTVFGVLVFVERERYKSMSVANTSAIHPMLPKSEIKFITMNIDWDVQRVNEKRNIVNVSWVEPKAEMIELNEEKEVLYFKQKGLYLFLLSLNLQGRKAEGMLNTLRTLICLKNNKFEEKCKRISLKANDALSISIESISELQNGDFAWVAIYGFEHLYRTNAGNYLIITKLA